jgi:sorbose reductase
VVSGAARGLRLAFAKALASAGCNIAVLDILPEPNSALFDLRSLHNIKVEYYRTDIASRDQVSQTICRIENEFGSIDININAAGVVTDEPFLSATFAVNFTGSFLVTQACANSMVARYKKSSHPTDGQPAAIEATTGTILFIASIATHIASTAQHISAYTASKAAERGLVKPLAMEIAPYGIRVNSMSPGYMMTDMMRGLVEQLPQLVW